MYMPKDCCLSPDINNIPAAFSDFFKPKGEFVYHDILWPVLMGEADQDPKMLKRIFDTVGEVSALSSRFLAVRYDLHLPEYQTDNRIMEQFHRKLFVRLRRQYPGSFNSYLWVREKDSARAQHYHYVLMMDGNHIRYPSKLTEQVKQCWALVAGGTVWVPENCFYFVEKDDLDTYSKLMLRLSYLGKRRTKESTSECRKRMGWGIRLNKRKPAVRARCDSGNLSTSTETAPSVTIHRTLSKLRPQTPEKTSDGISTLEKLFLGLLTLESLKPPAQPTKKKTITNGLDFPLEALWRTPRPDWEWHRQNYVYEVLAKGISLPEYAQRYRLRLTRLYANFRKVGGQSLRVIRWAWHRRCYRQGSVPLSQYIAEQRLHERTAIAQLKRGAMSAFWTQHFEHYYRQYWPLGWSVAAYCKVHDLNVSSARRHLVDFPVNGFINPLVLQPWM